MVLKPNGLQWLQCSASFGSLKTMSKMAKSWYEEIQRKEDD